jgi:hypothetical protein
MEEVKTNAGQGLGIAGLIMGIIAIPLAIIPCTTPVGFLIGIVGIVLGAVGLSQANKLNGTKGLPTAGLVVSITGTAIALLWMLFFAQALTEGGKWWAREGPKIMEEFNEEFGQEMEDAFEDLGEELEELGGELEEKLEGLEYEMEWEERWGDEITEEEFEEVLDTYESLIKDYIGLVEEANQGDVSALAEYVKVSARAVALATKITAISHRFTAEQLEQFEELQEKYEQALEEAKNN